MSPSAKDVRAPIAAPFRDETLRWFNAGETFTGMRHSTEYQPDRFWFVRLFVSAPFLVGLVLTVAAGGLYWYLALH